MSTIEFMQREIDRLLRVVERDISSRGAPALYCRVITLRRQRRSEALRTHGAGRILRDLIRRRAPGVGNADRIDRFFPRLRRDAGSVLRRVGSQSLFYDLITFLQRARRRTKMHPAEIRSNARFVFV
jgi:hypothetical protein